MPSSGLPSLGCAGSRLVSARCTLHVRPTSSRLQPIHSLVDSLEGTHLRNEPAPVLLEGSSILEPGGSQQHPQQRQQRAWTDHLAEVNALDAKQEWARGVRGVTGRRKHRDRSWEPAKLDPPAVLRGVAVVLVEPRKPVSIGIVARALRCVRSAWCAWRGVAGNGGVNPPARRQHDTSSDAAPWHHAALASALPLPFLPTHTPSPTPQTTQTRSCFEVEDLRVVAPRCNMLTRNALGSSKGAQYLLHRASTHETLAEALAGTSVSVAFARWTQGGGPCLPHTSTLKWRGCV